MPRETESTERTLDNDDVHEDFVDEDDTSRRIQYDYEDEGDEPDD